MLAGNKLSLKKLKGASTNLLNEQKKIYEDENQKYNFIVKNYDKTYNNFKNNLFELHSKIQNLNNYLSSAAKFYEIKDGIIFKSTKINLDIGEKKLEIYLSKLVKFMNEIPSFLKKGVLKELNDDDVVFQRKHFIDDEINFSVFFDIIFKNKYEIFRGPYLNHALANNIAILENGFKFKLKTLSNKITLRRIPVDRLIEADDDDYNNNTISFFNKFDNIKKKTFEKYAVIIVPYFSEKEKYLSYYQNKINKNDYMIRKIDLIIRSIKRSKEKTENVGYVYVLSNKVLPVNVYKIGSTYGLPEERAEELTGTGHLTPFKVAGEIKIQSAEYYEKSIHKILKNYRVKEGREFFKLDLKKIKDCFKQVSELSDKGKKKLTLSNLKKRIKI